ncbi:MAG: addiction module protein [Rhodoferax sp.]|jgi:hypothetical protein|uniref:addiction module protein n=1 Tax=Rhodoferax sp. TaxID=50421 RepID=UPI001B6B59C2|nr:addiction module protein [Rhodoferax sp.]MBP9061223.1 addiction module protein [Rhodoferax sp.]MBP9737819.1 addiction module protein [Rhodoferax sp.]
MHAHFYDLEAQVLKLDSTERAHLLERLIESFEPKSRMQKAWVDVARMRREEVRSGKAAMVPGNEALARVRARIA